MTFRPKLNTGLSFSNLPRQEEQGTAELGAKTVLKQTNELCFYRQKLPSPIAIGQSKWLGSLGLAQQLL